MADQPKAITVAIDGPAGAGKSTVAKMVAKALGLKMLDTGAMYRCAALLAARNGLGAQDGDAVAEHLKESQIQFEEGAPIRVILNGEEVTGAIRTPEMSDLASALSAHPPIRAILAEQQKQIVAQGGYVLEGRDTTSVVAPHAEVKVYLTASIEERAERRWKELHAKGMPVEIDELIRQIAERDARDMNRADSPLRRVPDALVVETFGLTPEEVAQRIIERARAVASQLA